MSTATTRPRRGLVARLAAIDDGSILRIAFYLLLAGTLSVLYLDFRELMAADAATTAATPLVPVLPAFDPSQPNAPGPHLTTDRAVLQAPLTVALKGGGVLQLTGTIDVGAADRVAAEVTARGEYIKTVALDSPGGSVADALAIGELFHARGYGTQVAAGALCASSCPLVFAGGVTRSAAPGAAIGIHQIYAIVQPGAAPLGQRAAGFGMAEAQKTIATITRYLTTMGVDPALWLHALETPPESLYYLSPDELRQFKLVTGTAPATT